MNTASHYKHFAGKDKKKVQPNNNVIDIKPSAVSGVLPTHIKLNSPPPMRLSESCNSYTYNITSAINTNLKDLPTKPSTISFCIYRIVTCENREKPAYPFLQYLLYKYPQSNTHSSDLMVFPFVKYKSGSIAGISSSVVKNIVGQDLTIKGFIENGEQLYLFFDLYETQTISVGTVNLKTRSQKLWWCLIDELCNARHVLTFPVHPSVYLMFYKNLALIYLKKDNKRLPSPIVGYHGNYYKFIPVIAAIGSQDSIRGQLSNLNLYYFSTFRKAVRYGSWSPLYRERIAYNKKITDIDGKYKKGGIVRFALFLDKINVPIDKSYDELRQLLKSEEKWSDKYNSMFIGSIDYDGDSLNINPEYILTNYNQYLSLSYHEIDMKTLLPNWDPSHNGYNIL